MLVPARTLPEDAESGVTGERLGAWMMGGTNERPRRAIYQFAARCTAFEGATTLR